MREEYRQSVGTHQVLLHGATLECRHIPGPPERAPLVFLHEGLGSVGLWTQRGLDWPLALAHATGRAAWLYSRRGYGGSEPIAQVRGPARAAAAGDIWRSGRHTPDYMAHEALEVLPRLLNLWGVQRPVLVGHSDGATIALLHASRFEVTACVAMAPHVFVEPVAIEAITQARQAYLDAGLRERLARHHADVDNAFWQWNDVWLSEDFRAFDIRQDCQRIEAPLLLVQGQEDEYGTLAQLQAIGQAVPHARQQVLQACGHSPHRDQPQALTDAVTAFLGGLG